MEPLLWLAGAAELREIKITPEMIEAGVSEFCNWEPRVDFDTGEHVCRIVCAALSSGGFNPVLP